MFLNFGNLKNERTGDRYWGKTIEKTMLRVLRSRTFSHSLGHKDAFSRPRLNGRCPFSQRTFARTRSNERDAPNRPFAGPKSRPAKFDPLTTFGPAYEAGLKEDA